MTRLGRWLVVMGMMAAASDARAQAVYTPDLPTTELGLTLGAYRLDDGGGFAGGRFSHALNPVVSIEVSGDHQGAGVTGGRENLLFTVAARFSTPTPVYEPRGYVTVGVARATGFDWSHSPMIGVGIQSPWDDLGLLSFRIEIQRFISGRRRLYDRGRFMLSGVIGFGRH